MSEQPWGRVDDDGTVYVRTADGERRVGEWLAGDPASGLAYYERRYQGLVVDVDLLSHRLKDAGLAPDEAMAKIGKIRAQLDDPQCVGDLEALRARLDALVATVQERRAQRVADREQAKERVKEQRLALVTEAERLAESTQWKATGDRFRALVEEWKQLPRHDRASEQELWRRLSHARAAFDKRRRAHFTELDRRRGDAQVRKEQLVRQAEELASSRDWGPTAARYRDLMRQWKEAGPAPRPADDDLWQRFRTAQDTFFTARSALLAERDAEQSAHVAAKEALLEEAERLLPVSDVKAARDHLRSIQDRWAAIGPVPKAQRDAVEGRLRAVEQAVRKAEEAKWKRTNPEARARAAATVEQLTTSLAKLNKQLDAARDKGDAKAVAAAEEAIAARQGWLAQAQQALDEFSG